MKKNVMMRVAALLMVCVLATTCGISGTFAKYTSEATSTATASVAKWDIKVNGASIANDFTFNLFADSAIVDTVDDNTDAEVANGKIAPGTKGTCQIVLKNDSDVDAEFTVVFTPNLAGVPLDITYKIDGTVYTGNTVNLDMGETVTIVIEWVWEFGDAVVDNAHSEKTPSVTATVTVDQRD